MSKAVDLRVGTKLLFKGYGIGDERKDPGYGIPCEIVGTTTDGRFIVERNGRRTRVSAKTLRRDYSIAGGVA